MRPLLRKENPGIAFKELGTRCGERWRELPPDEREVRALCARVEWLACVSAKLTPCAHVICLIQPYERMAKEDRARHTREMADYMATQG